MGYYPPSLGLEPIRRQELPKEESRATAGPPHSRCSGPMSGDLDYVGLGISSLFPLKDMRGMGVGKEGGKEVRGNKVR